MGRITGGEFRYLKRVQAAQFEPKEAEARISFAVYEGEDDTAIADRVRGLVLNQVARMLGQAGATPAVDPVVEADRGGSAPQAPAQPKPRGRPPGSPNKSRVDGKVVEVEPVTDPLDLGDTTQPQPTTVEQVSTATQTEATTTDPTAISIDDAVEEVVVTDAILQDKITRRNAALIEKIGSEAPKKIKALIATYAGGPSPKTARDIPADKRAAFLLELEQVS